MAGKNRVSRISPAYLASRHAGMFFMLAALGLLAGVAARTLLLPTRYRAEAEVAVAVVPPAAADAFDWSGRAHDWRSILSDPRTRGLLTGNLRHALKLAVTQDVMLDTALLGEELAQLDPPAEYSASLFTNGLVARLGPVIAVSRSDLAGNLDFQSLAAIVSDLDPPQGAADWDFTFFRDTPIIAARDGLVVEPGPDDRYFRVFYRLHAALNAGRPALSAATAWRTAVDEVTARLDREARFAGGGGFGHTAKRELMREIAAIPALAANQLYRSNDWLAGDEDGEETALWRERWSRHTVVDFQRDYGASGLVTASMEMDLYPLAFPRDTVLTRLPPMGTATLLAFLSALEEKKGKTMPVAATVSAPAPQTAAPTEPARQAVMTATPQITFTDVVDEAAAGKRLAAIAAAEERVRQTGLGRDAVLRRLETARANQNRLSREAVAARNRVDVLRERFDDTELAAARDYSPRVPPETASLFARRDALLRRLTELLDYCTEEHPFVKEVRRELAAVESQLATHSPDPGVNREAEIRATRLATLGLEYEAAVANADNLEERHRRQGEAVACLLEEVTGCERALAEREAELARAREVPVPMRRVRVETPAVAAAVEPVQPAETRPEPEPTIAATETPHLEFAATPSRIPLRRIPPGWTVPLAGLLCGILAGLVWIILRELFASRFYSVAEARRLVQLPVLAAIPAYDVKSLRTAAGTMNGELTRTRLGRLEFIPAPVDYAEPPPLARRGSVLPARKRPRFLAWIFVLVFLLLAALAQYKSQTGFARPRVGFQGELPLPAATVRVWADESEETEDWGNLP